MKYLYKYPQAAFPYAELLEENRKRGRSQPEYELLDTGVFDDDRYFDILVEYAKADVDDILVRITLENRGPETARVRVLPTAWFRNTWAWGNGKARPVARLEHGGPDPRIELNHPDCGKRWLICQGSPDLL